MTQQQRLNLRNALRSHWIQINELVFDFTDLEYISSAGLRVILKAQKIMNGKGGMKVINVNESIMDVFEITGFADFLTIE